MNDVNTLRSFVNIGFKAITTIYSLKTQHVTCDS
jgi:hypothetical protein